MNSQEYGPQGIYLMIGSSFSYRFISARSCSAASGGNIDNAAFIPRSERSRSASALSLPTAPTCTPEEGPHHRANQACHRTDHRGYAGNLHPSERRYQGDQEDQGKPGYDDPESVPEPEPIDLLRGRRGGIALHLY